ncbi:MAG: FMN-binding negative transcriptional regulator, partial [Sneathiella sp.]
YISPRDYASVVNVPTWNYVAVHASGRARILSGEADVIAVLKRLTAENEGDRANPWSLEEIEAKRISAMTKAIVAFEIPVDHLEAKAKLGQNKSAEDKQALVSASAGSDLEEWQNSIL